MYQGMLDFITMFPSDLSKKYRPMNRITYIFLSKLFRVQTKVKVERNVLKKKKIQNLRKKFEDGGRSNDELKTNTFKTYVILCARNSPSLSLSLSIFGSLIRLFHALYLPFALESTSCPCNLRVGPVHVTLII